MWSFLTNFLLSPLGNSSQSQSWGARFFKNLIFWCQLVPIWSHLACTRLVSLSQLSPWVLGDVLKAPTCLPSDQSCPTWARFPPWTLSSGPAPWGRLFESFPSSSPKWRGPSLETWYRAMWWPPRCPSAWASSSEDPGGLLAVDPWQPTIWLCLCHQVVSPTSGLWCHLSSRLCSQEQLPGCHPGDSFLLKEFLAPISSFAQGGAHDKESISLVFSHARCLRPPRISLGRKWELTTGWVLCLISKCVQMLYVAFFKATQSSYH